MSKIIAVDFDETIAVQTGLFTIREVPKSVYWLLEYQKLGANIILWTNRKGPTLWLAKAWCNSLGLYFTNENKNSWPISWFVSDKIYADMFIDNLALGSPVKLFLDKLCFDWDIGGPLGFKLLQ